ncbi:iron chelate uptake ABC transporter family permease subunit [Gracilibacillus salitolerans]|uniref:Iron chelate uptake ABC transporter family permease subunit n=1 Tax=Gracilibacillus salitolerans TaxID=2663022 RepID=A0A5Q2TH62_9BACI|nr:iron chelate uptake ABC transporter family permease subunit [Gracilibacillus salitolerans]QGH34179.1 iron chelate uptake ABC transporter family permease subunit [Gracilibacillus salitolerans]
MRLKSKLSILIMLSIILIAIYLFAGIPGNWEYILPRRFSRVLAIIVTGSVIAIATVVFQTITNNRILTPSVIGLDSLYVLLQTFFIFAFGSTSAFAVNPNLNFALSVGAMVVFAFLLYHLLFKKQKNVYFLLLVGIVFGTFFGSLSSFMQVLIDPNEFMIVQNRMFASFNNVNTEILWFAIILIVLTIMYLWKYIKLLDVMSLGKEHAINLGVDYDEVVKRLLIVIAIWISVATALVGPIMFLGLLVANVTYEFMKTYRHSYLLIASALVSIVALIGGQLVVDRIFSFETTLSVIINFIGGAYFLYLILKENKAW